MFRNRAGTTLKLLCDDGQGFWLCTQRLSQGRLQWWPRADGAAVSWRPASCRCCSGTVAPGRDDRRLASGGLKPGSGPSSRGRQGGRQAGRPATTGTGQPRAKVVAAMSATPAGVIIVSLDGHPQTSESRSVEQILTAHRLRRFRWALWMCWRWSCRKVTARAQRCQIRWVVVGGILVQMGAGQDRFTQRPAGQSRVKVKNPASDLARRGIHRFPGPASPAGDHQHCRAMPRPHHLAATPARSEFDDCQFPASWAVQGEKVGVDWYFF